jgi:hypothetical protein
MAKQHLHKLPVYRHPVTRARAVMSPIWGSAGYTVDVYPYKARTGNQVFMGLKDAAIAWIRANGYPVNS